MLTRDSIKSPGSRMKKNEAKLYNEDILDVCIRYDRSLMTILLITTIEIKGQVSGDREKYFNWLFPEL
jgi:hypothetical protein